jgi:membrane protein involved in colicin uptake
MATTANRRNTMNTTTENTTASDTPAAVGTPAKAKPAPKAKSGALTDKEKAKAAAIAAKAKAAKEKEAAKAKAAKEKEAAAKAKAAEKAKADKAKAAEKAAKAKEKAATVGASGKPTDVLRVYAKQYVHDKEHKTSGGNVSVDNGDELAAKLRGKDLSEVYKAAAKALGETEKDLIAKYGHLNVGMQRMNLGNRIRAALNAK